MNQNPLEVFALSELQTARSILERAERAGRKATKSELDAVEMHLEAATAAKTTLDGDQLASVNRRVNALTGGGKGDSLLAAFKSHGWEPGKRTTIDARAALKSASFDGDTDDLSPVRREGPALGADRRYVYPVIPAESVGAEVTSVQVVSQSSRTLPSPLTSEGEGPVVRAIDDTSTKPEAATERTLDSLPMKQVASIESGIPNILLQQPQFRPTVDQDLRLAYEQALDSLVVQAILDASPASSEAGGDLTESIVLAAAFMAESGYAGSVIALSPLDYAELMLLRGADEQFARSDPLSGFRFVQSMAIEVPLLLDPSALGRLYLSAVSLAIFEESAGQTNSSTVRLEGTAACHIARPDAVLEITGTSS